MTGPAMLVTIRPGPVLHVWQGGQERATVPLTPSAALTIATDLLRAVAEMQGPDALGIHRTAGIP